MTTDAAAKRAVSVVKVYMSYIQGTSVFKDVILQRKNYKYTSMTSIRIKTITSLLALAITLASARASCGVPIPLRPDELTTASPLYPTGICISESGDLMMCEKGTKRIALYSPHADKLLRTFPLGDVPTGITAKGDIIYVTTFAGTKSHLLAMSSADGKAIGQTDLPSGACNPLLSPDGDKLYTCNRYHGTVTETDRTTLKPLRTVKVLREPTNVVLSRDGKYLFVTNFLPAQRADVDYVAACVSVIEMKSFTKVKDIRLANGSNAVRGACLSPDGKHLYVTHNLGRYTVPTSQLQQGWMNTSAFSIIDVQQQAYLGVVITDEPERGAAGVWSIQCDDAHIYISHSGTHEISVIDHKRMMEKFLAYPDKAMLEYDLNFLYGIRQRIPLAGNGPRQILLDGNRLIVPTYFADIVNFLDTQVLTLSNVNLNPRRQESDIDRGEKYFNDASHCFQNWQSCNGCHPGDGRADGMNWDLMNDGIGNSKNCKSMLYSHVTAPCMISGIRASAELAVRAGFKFIQFFDVSEEDARCVDAYLKSLQPVPSPYLVDGNLSPLAKEGKKIFERLKCGDCHSGVYFTDMKMYRIGDDIEFERGWDTPTLREVWRTAPYLFDGRAATMQDVFKQHRHGIKGKISDKEVDALTEYVNSL